MIINVQPKREARQNLNVKIKREARNLSIGFALRVYFCVYVIMLQIAVYYKVNVAA